jgi:hypothetical protein
MIIRTVWTGISPMEWDAFIDKHADKDYQMDDLI